MLFNKFLEHTEYVYITKDIEIDEYNKILKENFNSYDFNTDKFIENSSKVILVLYTTAPFEFFYSICICCCSIK